MHKLTEETLSEEIFQEIGVGKEEEKLRKYLNECYQYGMKLIHKVNKGDYKDLRLIAVDYREIYK